MTTKPDEVREAHRSFTVRVPLSRYIQMTTMARADSMNMNQKANQLLQLGMGQHINLDTALARLLRTQVIEEVPTND
jgi:hypothetical protein